MAKYKPSVEVRENQLLIDGDAQSLPGFIPLRVIGQGANGVAIVATDLSLDREVAIKVWTRQHRRAKQGVAEAAKLARFNHPLIGAVWAFHPESPKPWAVLELVQGQTVAEWLEQPQSIGNRFIVWTLFAAALRHIHDTGSVHGDPHTKNLILTPNPVGHMSFFVPQPFLSMTFGHGLKVLDAGASILWNQPEKLVAREATVLLETFERLFQVPELLELLDYLPPQPSPRLTALNALARLQAGLLLLSESHEEYERADIDDSQAFDAASQRWSSARSVVLDTICQDRVFNLGRVVKYLSNYPIYKRRLLVEDLGHRLGFDTLHHPTSRDDRIPSNSIEILQARYDGLPDISWSW